MPFLGKYSIFWLFHKIKSAWPYLSQNVAIRFLSLLDSRSDGIFFGWNNLEPGWHFENVWFLLFDILELISRRGSESIRLRVKRGAFSRNDIIPNQSEYRIFFKIIVQYSDKKVMIFWKNEPWLDFDFSNADVIKNYHGPKVGYYV